MQNKIEMYIHCQRCLEIKPDHISPSEYSQMECGFTEDGFQVWCMRCNINILYLEVEEMEFLETPNNRKELN